ncbi:MAG: class IV adenylate cyclase [Patescibacteria group bacterium]
MKEIEILFEIKNQKEGVLKSLGRFTAHGIKRTLDIYFADPLRKDLQRDADGRLRASFRLRQKDDKCSIAYKNDHFNNDEWIYSDEHETSVGDFDIAIRIIEHLGLKELVRIDNEKYTFTTPEYEIVFEDVKNLGYFLEVEKLHEVPDEMVVSAKQEIRDFASNLGLNLGSELNAGKPELMLAKIQN